MRTCHVEYAGDLIVRSVHTLVQACSDGIVTGLELAIKLWPRKATKSAIVMLHVFLRGDRKLL